MQYMWENKFNVWQMVQDRSLECVISSWLFTVFILKCITNVHGDGRDLLVGI